MEYAGQITNNNDKTFISKPRSYLFNIKKYFSTGVFKILCYILDSQFLDKLIIGYVV